MSSKKELWRIARINEHSTSNKSCIVQRTSIERFHTCGNQLFVHPFHFVFKQCCPLDHSFVSFFLYFSEHGNGLHGRFRIGGIHHVIERLHTAGYGSEAVPTSATTTSSTASTAFELGEL